MAKQVQLKSLSTGLSGLYPESHLGLDPDLVLDVEDPDCDCWVKQDEEEFVAGPDDEFVVDSDQDDLEPWEKELLSELDDKEDK